MCACGSRSVVSNFETPWTVAHQAPLSMEFSRQEYWSGLPFLSPGDLSDPGIKPESPALQVDSLLSELPEIPPEMQYLGAISKITEESQFISMANCSISQ